MQDYYLHYCPNCNRKTKQVAIIVSRLRGVKLQCMECMKVKKRYIKFNKLKGGNSV